MPVKIGRPRRIKNRSKDVRIPIASRPNREADGICETGDRFCWNDGPVSEWISVPFAFLISGRAICDRAWLLSKPKGPR